MNTNLLKLRQRAGYRSLALYLDDMATMEARNASLSGRLSALSQAALDMDHVQHIRRWLDEGENEYRADSDTYLELDRWRRDVRQSLQFAADERGM